MAGADVPLRAAAPAVVVLRANVARVTAICKNVGAVNGLRLGDSMTDATHGIPLKPGEELALDAMSAIYASGAAGTTINCGEVDVSNSSGAGAS